MFDSYKVSVRLHLINGVTGGLAAISAQLGLFNKSIVKTQAELDTLHAKMQKIAKMGAIGGGAAAAGVGMAHLFKAPLDEAKKFDQAVGKFKLFGMSDKVNAEAVRFAKSMNIIGSSYTENMKLITEAQGVFRESGASDDEALKAAKLAAPFLAKVAMATSSLDGESAAKMKTSSLAMLRYIEMSGGLQSPEKFKQLADGGWRMIQTSGGAVDWEQLRQFKARAGIAAQSMTPEAMAGMEPIIGELKGSTAGFGLRTAWNRLNGIIKIPNQVAHTLVDNGLWDASKVNWNSQGGIKSFNGNPLKDSNLMMQNQIEFYEKDILPMYAKMGLNTPEDRARMNGMIFGSTGGTLFSLLDKQLSVVHRSIEAYRKSLGIDDSADVASKTLTGKELDMHAKWKDVLEQLGETVLPLAIKGIEGLTAGLTAFNTFANQNRDTVRTLALSFAGLAGAMMFGGTVMLLKAGFDGLGLVIGGIGRSVLFLGRALLMNPIGLTITAIAAAAYLLYRNWDTVGPYVKKTWEVIKHLFKSGAAWVADKWDSIYGSVKGGLTRVYDFVASIVNRIGDFLANSPIGRAIGFVGGVIKDGAHAAADAVMSGAKHLYTDAIADNYAASYSNEGRNYVRPAVAQPAVIQVQSFLDGRLVSDRMDEHKRKFFQKPQLGTGLFDPSLTPISPGMTIR